MANADELQVLFKEESAFGTNPAGGSFETLRFTDESLRQETQTTASREIRPDRQVTDLIRTNVSAAGGFSYEFSYSTFDTLLAAAFLSAGWSSVVTHSATDIAATAGFGSYVLVRGTGSWVTDGFAVGQWVRVSGYTTTGTGNNGYGKISAVTATDLTIQFNGDGATKASGDTVEVEMGAQIVNGTSVSSFAFQREWTDLSNKFALNLGLVPSQWSLETDDDTILNGSFDFLGKIESSHSSDQTGGSPVAATTTSVMNAIDNISAIFEGLTTAAASVDLTSLSVNLNNNLRTRGVIGTLGAISIGSGKIAVTGSIEGYYEDETLIDKYLNFNATTLAIKMLDANGNAYILEFPRVKFSAGTRNNTGENTDVMFNLDFTAYMHPTESVTIRLARWAV